MEVAVVGGSGYGGGELLRLLAGHPAFKVRTVAAASSAGRRIVDVFPNLGLDGELVPADPDELAGCAVVFLATPAEASAGLVPALAGRVGVTVDLSDAFRADPDAVYGLPELYRDEVRSAGLVANPGCYPTAALLALAPLAGLVDPASVTVVGMSGTSGAGRGLREDLHASHAFANAAAYGAPGHRHTPEIEAAWGRLTGAAAPVTFVPHIIPMARGLLCTVSAQLSGSEADVASSYRDRYAGEPFVTVVPSWPHTTHVTGANAAHVHAAVDRAGGRVVASCAIDNLVKGAAGQAIQNANLACGLPEDAGLPTAGLYP